MPDPSISANHDAMIDAAVRRWSTLPFGVNPRERVSPAELRHGAGFYGATPAHVGDFHAAAAVLAGTSGSAVVSPDFFNGHRIARRLQARLIAAGHSVRPVAGGVAVVAGGPTKTQPKAVAKYAADPQRPAHKLVRGFRVEHALRHLTTDPAASPDTQTLASRVLYDGDTGALLPLHKSLTKDGHFLLNRYNWTKAAHGIHVDDAVGSALEAIEGRGNGTRRLSREDSSYLLLRHVGSLRPRTDAYTDENVEIARQAHAELAKHISPADLLKSIARHRLRYYDADDSRYRPERRAAITAAAVGDAPHTPWESPREVASSRYARRSVRRAIHPLLRGTRLSHVLREFAAHDDIELRATAREALRSGDSTAVGAAGDRAAEIGHALADRYNWGQATRGLAMDRELRKFVIGRALANFREEVGEHRNPATSEERQRVADVYRRRVENLGYHAFTYGVARDSVLFRHLTPKFDGLSSGEVAKSLARLHLRERDYTERRRGRGYPDSTSAAAVSSHEAASVRRRALSPVEEAQEPVGDGMFKSLGLRRNFEERAARFRRSRAAKYARGVEGFVAALRRVRSRQQQVLRKLAHAVAKKLKLALVRVVSAIFDDGVNSVPHVASVVRHGDRNAVTAAAALLGLQSNAPALGVFHEADDGKDALHALSATGSGERLRAALDRHGLRKRTLLPTKNGWRVLLYDEGRRSAGAVAAFAKSVGSPLTTVYGEGEFIGGGDDPRRQYRSLL